MANDLNKIIIIGRLTKDPELKNLSSQKEVVIFSVANNRSWTHAGEKVVEVSFFNCVAWGKLATLINQYCKKGNQVAIAGRLQQNRWEDQNGNKRSNVEIVVDSIQFLDAGEKNTQPPEKLFDDKEVKNIPNFDDVQDIPF